MKKCSTLQLLLATISLFLSVSLQAQEMSPITVHVETAGTLSTLIPEKDKYLITDLTLSGNLNGADMLYIREMAGGGLWKDSKTDGKLKKMDIANSNIVSGGGSYYQYYDESDTELLYSKTSDDHISEYMFYNLSNLNSIVLPQNITCIDEKAFADCKGLTSLIIQDNVTIIWNNAFSGCAGLKNIMIPNSVVYIHSDAFMDCTGLSSINIGSGLTYIDEFAFRNCIKLNEFIVSESNTKFTSVEGVLLNKDKTEIIAYPNAKSSTYTIPNSVNSIGKGAFAYCSNIASVTIPINVNKIKSGAFVSCTGLTSVTIPASVTGIVNENPFLGCTALKEFIVSDDNPNYKTIDGVLFSKDGTQIIAYPDAKSSEYTIPNGVEKVIPYVFAECATLSSVTIPNSVKTISDFSFSHSPSLSSVNMGENITDIGMGAFSNCTGLKSIKIPNNVSVIFPWAFMDCKNLSSVFLSNSVMHIYDYAFLRCIALKEIHCKKAIPSQLETFFQFSTNPYVFAKVDKTTCKLYVPKGSYSAYKSAEGWNEFNIILEEESTAISEVETNNVSVYTESGNVVIKNAEPGKIVSVYNTLGALLQTVKVTDNELRINLPINQIYFIRIADKRYKVAL